MIPNIFFVFSLLISGLILSGTGNTGTDGTYKPSFLTDQELKHLILEVGWFEWGEQDEYKPHSTS
jgi:hypothetical protein